MVNHARRALHTVRTHAARRAISGIARSVLDNHLTYLSPQKLRNIEWAIQAVDDANVAGSFIETGVALGGSGILMASRLGPDRAYHGYDVFGMIPAPTAADPPEVHERYRLISSGEAEGIEGERYYGYEPDLYDRVRRSFADYSVPVDGQRVCLHQGLFEDTLRPSEPVALAHIDCDWYDPVLLSLDRIFPHLQPGGLIVIDDYFSYGGARRAVDEFLAGHPDLRPTARDRHHMILRRG
jgi:O-methyltransferase